MSALSIAQFRQTVNAPPMIEERLLQPPQTQRVRQIQLFREEEPCFATEKRHDCVEICEWRKDCRKLMAAWLR